MNFIRKNHFGISGEIINEKWFDVKMAGWPFLNAFNLLEMKSSVKPYIDKKIQILEIRFLEYFFNK